MMAGVYQRSWCRGKFGGMFRIAVLLLMAFPFLFAEMSGQSQTPRWYKGNLHTHTLNSDGDSPPEEVVKWYASNGYNFLFITDHEFLTPVGPLNEKFSEAGRFMVFQGQEVTDRLPSKPLHINGLGVRSVCTPRRTGTVVEILQRNIECVRAAGGIPLVNHPNFGWALTANDIAALNNVALLDIHNGHPLVNNLGGGGRMSTEAIWDAVLSAGRTIYGVAVDDSHYFKRLGDRAAPTPGWGWVVVRAEGLNEDSIKDALERGDFYASTGVSIDDIIVDGSQIRIKIREDPASRYTVHFIGRNGRILKTTYSNPAVYSIRGTEGYVRAKIIESNGKMALTQPVRIAGRKAVSERRAAKAGGAVADTAYGRGRTPYPQDIVERKLLTRCRRLLRLLSLAVGFFGPFKSKNTTDHVVPSPLERC